MQGVCAGGTRRGYTEGVHGRGTQRGTRRGTQRGYAAGVHGGVCRGGTQRG